MSNVSIFSNFSSISGENTLEWVAKEIASSRFLNEVQEIQHLFTSGQEELAQQRKRLLPAFTPSGTFKNRRTAENLAAYSGYVHIDFDKIPPAQMEDAFNLIRNCGYTVLCFRSPSGKGLKVFAEVNTGAEQHTQTYIAVMKFYEDLTGLKADEKCKDITRLCFMSHDPQLYFNPAAMKFSGQSSVVSGQLEVEDVQPVTDIIYDVPANNDAALGRDMTCHVLTVFDECVALTEHSQTYINGNRNAFIYLLASTCNRKGISEPEALKYALTRYDLGEQEIRASFHSAYKNHTEEFATGQSSVVSGQLSVDSPFIPDEVYKHLPLLLQQGSAMFPVKRERDVFFTGALSILSGCIPGVKGVYDRDEVLPNLFTYIIAPAASGKSALKYARMMAQEYHKYMLEISGEALAHYKKDLAVFNHNTDKGDAEPPQEPPFKVVFIPADTSYSQILSHLKQNNGAGIICETESDTLGNIFKKDWGSYSDLLRKDFHNEPLACSRKTNKEFTEISAPAVAVALSGTPNQVTALIASAEDGLFSRFLFYAFKVDQKWKKMAPQADFINCTEEFTNLSKKVFDMVMFLAGCETLVELTSEQWDKLDAQCSQWLADVIAGTGEEAASVVKRMGLIIYRIAMLFTAMRKWENKCLAYNAACTDEDFNTALALGGIYLEHSKVMYNALPKHAGGDNTFVGQYTQTLLSLLPKEFTRKDALEKGKELNISVRTVDKILLNTRDGEFEKISQGKYLKK